MNIQQAIKKVISCQNLTADEMSQVMQSIMSGQTTNSQIGGFLCGLATKGETVDEIVGAVKVMRKLSVKVDFENSQYLVDTCGTGGDNKGLFNVSTATAFVVASAGIKVAKHGNRSISSNSGSADLLELAGVNLNMTPDEIKSSIDKIGVGFMFAQNHHSAMRHAIAVRQELKTRTIFNLLGPLTNPANAKNQLIGVYDKKLCNIFAQVLKKLGARHSLIVHSNDGLDEISAFDKTFVCELFEGKITEYEISPTDFGLKSGDIKNVIVENSEQSLKLVQNALDGISGEAMDIVALNAGAAIYISGKVKNLKQGVEKAIQILQSGQAHQKLDDFIRISTGC